MKYDSTKAIDLLRRDSADSIERYGKLEGTPSQREIAQLALEEPTLTLQQIADRLDVSPQWVEKVLPRVTDEWVREELESRGEREPIADEIDRIQHTAVNTMNDETDVQPASAAMIDDERVLLTWDIDGDLWREVIASEYCDECGESRNAVILIPSDEGHVSHYECGHSPDTGPGWLESVRRYRQLFEDVLKQALDRAE